MNTLAGFSKATVADFPRRFDREQLVVIFSELQSAPRTLLDSAQLVEWCQARIRSCEQAPILAQLRKFSPWQAACFQIWVFAFWDDFNGSNPFDSHSYAFFQGRHASDYHVMHDAVRAVLRARQAVEATQIANWHLEQARKTYLEVEDRLQEAMSEC